ncbi:MAG TPA: ferric reductase [Actinomycetota bacterium]|nr:ferric reductase [Actinomycetota bacterium]
MARAWPACSPARTVGGGRPAPGRPGRWRRRADLDRGQGGRVHRLRAAHRVGRARPGPGAALAVAALARWATTELHRFVTLLTLVFLGLHVLLLALDGYMRFRPVELLVPFANHYRPLWTGLGVVAAWLALAVWASTWLQGLIGYRAWRRLHLATFVVYATATVHGLQAGSDGHTPWALAGYAASALTVAGLTAARLAGARRPAAQRLLEPSPAERV